MSVWCQRRPRDAYRRRAAFPDDAVFVEVAPRPDADLADADLALGAGFFAEPATFFAAGDAVRAPADFLPPAVVGFVDATAFLPADAAFGAGLGAALAAALEAAALAAALGTGFADAAVFPAAFAVPRATGVGIAFAAVFPEALPEGALDAVTACAVRRGVAPRPCSAGGAGAFRDVAVCVVVAALAFARAGIFGATTTGGVGCLNTCTNRS